MVIDLYWIFHKWKNIKTLILFSSSLVIELKPKKELQGWKHFTLECKDIDFSICLCSNRNAAVMDNSENVVALRVSQKNVILCSFQINHVTATF